MIRQKRTTLVIFTLLICIHIMPGISQTEIFEYNIPVVETFDLLQVGTVANPYIVNITKDFHVMTKLNWILHFNDNTLDWEEFAADTALSNGILLNYSSFTIDKPITNNHELMNLAYNAHHFRDDKNPVGHIIWIQHLITSNIPSGILINDDNTIHIMIQDDLTAVGFAIESFDVSFIGYKTIEVQTYNENFQGEDLLTLIENFWRSNSMALMAIGVSIFGFLLIWRFFRR